MNREQVLHFWGERVSAKDIADRLGISTARVYQVLKEEGRSPTRRGRPPRPGLPAFAALLRKHRAAAGLTQAELAARCAMPVGTLRNLEQGATEPLLSTAKKLADALGVRVDELAE